MRRIALLLSLAVAAPAVAEVRAGVAAWNRQEYAAAVAEWQGPAKAGDADARYNLGQAYRKGQGVPKDLARAEALYRQAAAQGHAQAQASLALLLFDAGQMAQAVPWFEKAAKAGEPRAQYVVATMLFNGEGQAKDWPRAYAIMNRAAAAGLEPAKKSLAQMDKWLSATEKKQGLALARGMAIDETVDAAVRRPAPAEIAASRRQPPPRGLGWRVQLGAFNQTATARAQWRKLAADEPFAGLVPVYAAGRGLVRLQTGPFVDRAAASKACTAAKARGSGCFVVTPDD